MSEIGEPLKDKEPPKDKEKLLDKAIRKLSFNKKGSSKKGNQQPPETSHPGLKSVSEPPAASTTGTGSPVVLRTGSPQGPSAASKNTVIPQHTSGQIGGQRAPGPAATSRSGAVQTGGQRATGTPTTSRPGSPQGRGQQIAGTQATSSSGVPQNGGQSAIGKPTTASTGPPPSGGGNNGGGGGGGGPPVPPGTSTSSSARTWVRNGIVAETRLSTIFLCTNLLNNKKFIAKTVAAQELEPRTAIEIERRMYKGYKPIHSPYFIQHLGFNIEENCMEMDNREVCNLFLEWVPHGSLSMYIHRHKEPLKESLIATFCRDILKALVYLHGQGKIHGDIKASNILVGGQCLRLCDLGSGKVISDGDVLIPPKKGQNRLARRIYTTGSDGFRAPEVEEETEQGPAADIYAVGCTLVEMATGDPPQRCPRIFRSHETNPKTGFPAYSIDLPTEFSKAAFEFLEMCLAENPNHRPSAKALLNHRWFTESVLRYPIEYPN